jgi:hypothetical protein
MPLVVMGALPFLQILVVRRENTDVRHLRSLDESVTKRIV